MSENNSNLLDITKLADRVLGAFNLEKIAENIQTLTVQASDPDIWDNPSKAQEINQKLANANSEFEAIKSLQSQIEDVKELSNLDLENTEQAELTDEINSIRACLEALEIKTLLTGKYDEADAIISIRPGAGGVDSADFADMLLRMYMRYASNAKYNCEILSIQKNEEAGIKGATIQISAPYAYGKLALEAGTHRLVRISPFNAQGKRQTSFAAVEVIPLIKNNNEIIIDEKDVKIDVFRSSGPGGQSVNTTDSAVRLTHQPTGIVISMQNERSQLQNKEAAFDILRSKLLVLKNENERAEKKELQGEIKASWSDQMRNYTLQPFQLVKDVRTGYSQTNAYEVLDGEIDGFINAEIHWNHNNSE